MIEWKLKGLDELERQLTALGKRWRRRCYGDAGREALKVVREEDMKQHAGFDETSTGSTCGTQSKSVLLPERRGNTVVTLRVGPSKQHHMKALAQELGTVKQVAAPLSDPPGLQRPDRFARVDRGN